MDTTKINTLKNYSELEIIILLEIIENKGKCNICYDTDGPVTCPLIHYCKSTIYNKGTTMSHDVQYQHHQHIKVKMAMDRLVYERSTLNRIIREQKERFDEYLRKNR